MLIADLWRHEAGKYFCISTKTKGGVWHDEYFARSELDEVADYVRERRDRNVYFCPHGLSAKHRCKANAVLPSLLWADIDEVDPRKLKLRPTIAIESSPDRYVGIWECDRVVSEGLNQRLSYAIGADKSGWDLSQVLRAPRTINYKYASQPRVKLLWRDGPEYRVSDLERLLPRIKERERQSDTGVGDIGFDAARALLRDVPALKRKFVRIWMAMNAPPMINEEGRPDRSETWMWQARLMRDVGASDEEMAALLTLCRRTFADRFPRGLDDPRARDEIERLCSKLEKTK